MNRLSSQHHMSTYAERRKRIPDLCVYVLGDGSPLTECGWRKIAVRLQIRSVRMYVCLMSKLFTISA